MDIFNKASKQGLFLTLNQVVLQVQGCHVLGSETIMFCPKKYLFFVTTNKAGDVLVSSQKHPDHTNTAPVE